MALRVLGKVVTKVSYLDVTLKIIAIIICATKLMSCPKFQRYSSIFDLVTEEKRPSRYLGDVALTGRGKSFQIRCKSESFLLSLVPCNLYPAQISTLHLNI